MQFFSLTDYEPGLLQETKTKKSSEKNWLKINKNKIKIDVNYFHDTILSRHAIIYYLIRDVY